MITNAYINVPHVDLYNLILRRGLLKRQIVYWILLHPICTYCLNDFAPLISRPVICLGDSNHFSCWDVFHTHGDEIKQKQIFAVLFRKRLFRGKERLKLINFPCSVQTYANPPVRNCRRAPSSGFPRLLSINSRDSGSPSCVNFHVVSNLHVEFQIFLTQLSRGSRPAYPLSRREFLLWSESKRVAKKGRVMMTCTEVITILMRYFSYTKFWIRYWNWVGPGNLVVLVTFYKADWCHCWTMDAVFWRRCYLE